MPYALRELLRLPAADGFVFREGGILGLWGGECGINLRPIMDKGSLARVNCIYWTCHCCCPPWNNFLLILHPLADLSDNSNLD
jgi:hypothetical protein